MCMSKHTGSRRYVFIDHVFGKDDASESSSEGSVPVSRRAGPPAASHDRATPWRRSQEASVSVSTEAEVDAAVPCR